MTLIRTNELKAFAKEVTLGRMKPRRINDAMQKLLEQIWKESGAVFARELSAQVLVETGESVGSLEPLARFTGAILKFRSPSKTLKYPKPSLNLQGGKTGETRSFASGVKKGEGAFKFEFSPSKFFFSFSIPVFQFLLHDTGRAVHPKTSAVGASIRARKAQEDFVRREFQRRAGDLLRTWVVTGKTNG